MRATLAGLYEQWSDRIKVPGWFALVLHGFVASTSTEDANRTGSRRVKLRYNSFNCQVVKSVIMMLGWQSRI